MRSVRLYFTKLAQAKYISHLDINRCMTRAMRRAAIPLWYTEGFNPHPYIMFSLPLPLGVESECESMEIRLQGDISNEQIKAKLNSVLPGNIQITAVLDDYKNAKEIAFARYRIIIDFLQQGDAAVNVAAIESKIAAALSSGEIMAEKSVKQRRKKVLQQINIAPLIDECVLHSNQNAIEMQVTLAAGIAKNLSPTLFVDAVMAAAGVSLPCAKSICRTALLTSDKSSFQ